MQYSIATLALLGAAAVSAAPAINGTAKRQSSTAYIQFGSMCSDTVYYEVFENTGKGVTGGKLTSGVLYNQPGFQSAEVNYGEQSLGISIKASFQDNPSESGPVLQFEVDQDLNNNLINYDISAVNGDPFKAYGSSIYIDSPSGPCDNVQCPAGDDSCAFQYPEDNSKDHGCGGTQHVVYAQVCDVV